MKRIFKYPLAIEREQTLLLPRAATILCVQAQRGQAQLWAAVDDGAAIEARHIFMCGTGGVMPVDLSDGATYLGSVQLNDGHFVWHFFEGSPQ
jgi:hypothetical protein